MAARKSRAGPKPPPPPAREDATTLVPVKPAPEKIGESRDNLKARERAFQNRRRRAGS